MVQGGLKMNNAFFFDNKEDLNYFVSNDWDENVPIRIEKRLTQYTVVTQED